MEMEKITNKMKELGVTRVLNVVAKDSPELLSSIFTQEAIINYLILLTNEMQISLTKIKDLRERMTFQTENESDKNNTKELINLILRELLASYQLYKSCISAVKIYIESNITISEVEKVLTESNLISSPLETSSHHSK